LQKLTEVGKIAKKTLYVSSWSFEVIEFGTNRNSIIRLPISC